MIIESAINGVALTKRLNPHLAYDSVEIADDEIATRKAGAALVHFMSATLKQASSQGMLYPEWAKGLKPGWLYPRPGPRARWWSGTRRGRPQCAWGARSPIPDGLLDALVDAHHLPLPEDKPCCEEWIACPMAGSMKSPLKPDSFDCSP